MNDHEINCKLRERTLTFWISSAASPVTLLTFEQSKLNGIYCTIDSNQEKIQIAQLETPTFTYAEAMVRTNDLLYMNLKAREVEEGELL